MHGSEVRVDLRRPDLFVSHGFFAQRLWHPELGEHGRGEVPQRMKRGAPCAEAVRHVGAARRIAKGRLDRADGASMELDHMRAVAGCLSGFKNVPELWADRHDHRKARRAVGLVVGDRDELQVIIEARIPAKAEDVGEPQFRREGTDGQTPA